MILPAKSRQPHTSRVTKDMRYMECGDVVTALDSSAWTPTHIGAERDTGTDRWLSWRCVTSSRAPSFAKGTEGMPRWSKAAITSSHSKTRTKMVRNTWRERGRTGAVTQRADCLPGPATPYSKEIRPQLHNVADHGSV